jgi:hypothetical protein
MPLAPGQSITHDRVAEKRGRDGTLTAAQDLHMLVTLPIPHPQWFSNKTLQISCFRKGFFLD